MIEIYAVKTEPNIKSQRKKARELLYFAVKEMFGVSESELAFERDKNGKPYFADREGIFFSISHSGEYAVVAVGGSKVGIDIEKNKNISERVIKKLLCGCPESEAVRRWTERESYGKFTGEGVLKADFKKEHRFAYYDDIVGYTVTVCAEKNTFPSNIKFPEIKPAE